MKSLLSLIISGALVVSGFGQTRNVLVGTNNAVVQPTNFWSADASNARTGLGLGTAATNPASAFQPASSSLTNLASGNGGALTNLQATNLVGLIPTSNIPSIVLTSIGTITIQQGGTGATNAANARQNLGSTTVGDALFIATDAASARTTIGATTVGSSVFTLVNPSAITFLRLNADNTATALSAADFRTALSLGTAATNPSSAFQPASSALTNLSTNNGVNLTNIPVAGVVGALATNGNGAGLTNLTAANITGTVALASNITGTVALASNVTGTIAISNGGSGATTAGGARTNLGLVLTALTNTNADEFRAGIGLGGADSVEFFDVTAEELKAGTNVVVSLVNQELTDNGVAVLSWSTNGIDFFGSGVKAATRTNLGLGASWLTNTNNPVFVNTNGEVVSPTNFWQVAPIATLLQNSTPVVNATNAATNARLLFLFSLAPSTVGVTNTITLPTNGGTFNGDVATITHSGPTSSVTAVRQLGASTNIITLNQVDESVRFLYRNNQWTLMDNISYIEPIYFSGTNASNNIAMSRSNLGLGVGQTVNFQTVQSEVFLVVQGTNTYFQVDDAVFDVFSQPYFDHPSGISFNTNNASAANTRTNLGLGATNNVTFSNVAASGTLTSTGVVTAVTNLNVGGAIAVTNAALTRTNLGLPLDALTNTSVTNFQKAIFYTNTAPSNIGGNLGTTAAWIEIVASNGVTYKVPAYTNVP